MIAGDRCDIAIPGGGFSGTLPAVQLLGHAPAGFRLTLVERSSTIGRGVAYCEQPDGRLLNVVAANMRAFPDQPGHLLDWLRHRRIDADASETG